MIPADLLGNCLTDRHSSIKAIIISCEKNATMHPNHKPREIMQVDWAGDMAPVVDTDTGVAIPTYVLVVNDKT